MSIGVWSYYQRSSIFSDFTSGKTSILVTTDLASRGIDTQVEVLSFLFLRSIHTQVPHVLLYDFPSNVIDYLHRIGRTARAGKDGVVTAFVQQSDQALVNNIRVRLFGSGFLS